MTAAVLGSLNRFLAIVSLLPAFILYTIVKDWMTKSLFEQEERERKALEDAHWVRGIGTLVDAIEHSGDTPTRRSEIAELTRILPHVRHHHRRLIDDRHLHHLLQLITRDAQESKELLTAGLAAIENLGWIEAIGPLEDLARKGMRSRKELSHCLSALHERERAIREHDTLVRPADNDDALPRPITAINEAGPEQLLHVFEDRSGPEEH